LPWVQGTKTSPAETNLKRLDGVGCLGISGKKLLGVFHLRLLDSQGNLHMFFLVKIKLKGYLISLKFSKNSMVEILIWSLELPNLTPELLGPSVTKTP